MAPRERPFVGSAVVFHTGSGKAASGSFFGARSGAKRVPFSALRDAIRIQVVSPQLDTFLHDDLAPANILRGAGLAAPKGVPASVVIEAGFPATVVREFAVASGIASSDVGDIVGTSDRTMSRKVANRERLGAAESDRAYRLFDMMARAVHAFGDVDKALRWMRREVPSLGGRRPIDLLRTELGTREVLSALDRIEYGGVA
jgi:putative toxin-antitoxin system antitoxin component (TIGR02293 family)